VGNKVSEYDDRDIETVSDLTNIVWEIVVRKRAEEKLRDSETKFRALFENSQDAIFLTCPDGRIQDANRAASEMFGMTEEELIQAGREGIVDKEDPRIAPALEERARTGRFFGELTYLRMDGTRFPAETSSVIMDDAANTFVMLRDITERKQREQELRDSEERYRRLFEMESDAVHLLDLETGRFMDANPAARALYGYTLEEYYSLTPADISAEPDKTRDAISTGDSRVPYRLHRKKDGTVFPVEISACIFEYRGRKVLAAAIRDISERIQAEETLRESLREKEVLLREVHHRVKNNLAAIMGLVDMQRPGIQDQAAAAALLDLCSRIKSMAFVHERLYHSDNLSRIDFQDYLRGLISHLRISYANRPDIRCSVEAAGVEMGLDLAVPCALLISELLTNAFKYAFPLNAPFPVVHQCEIRVTVTHGGDDYCIIVADNGVGLPPDLDWRSSSTLGLRLVRMVGEHQMGGRITLDQTGGTRFALSFTNGRGRKKHAG
jgi:PAS domain S-box-containing protein